MASLGGVGWPGVVHEDGDGQGHRVGHVEPLATMNTLAENSVLSPFSLGLLQPKIRPKVTKCNIRGSTFVFMSLGSFFPL